MGLDKLGAKVNTERVPELWLFLISLVFAAIFYRVLSEMAPFGIDLDDVNKSSLATAVYTTGFIVFLGVIVYGSLLLPV